MSVHSKWSVSAGITFFGILLFIGAGIIFPTECSYECILLLGFEYGILKIEHLIFGILLFVWCRNNIFARSTLTCRVCVAVWQLAFVNTMHTSLSPSLMLSRPQLSLPGLAGLDQ